MQFWILMENWTELLQKCTQCKERICKCNEPQRNIQFICFFSGGNSLYDIFGKYIEWVRVFFLHLLRVGDLSLVELSTKNLESSGHKLVTDTI